MKIKDMRNLAQKYGYNIQSYFSIAEWKYRIVEYKDGYDLLSITDYHSKQYALMLLNYLIVDQQKFEVLNLYNMPKEHEMQIVSFVDNDEMIYW